MITQTLDTLTSRFAVPILITFLGLGALTLQGASAGIQAASVQPDYTALADEVSPANGVELPVVWGDLGKKLVERGVIDREKWTEIYRSLSAEEARLIDGNSPEKLRITRENAAYLLNLFWALGLGNQNPILQDEAGMENPEYGGAGYFASTGGWSLAKGEAMEHYGKYALAPLTGEQQALVKKISDGIYRPCCDNPTSFPDCNHGMAMLGLLELLAYQGANEEEMWDAALAANSYWFPDTYQIIALSMKQRGVAWSDVSPQEVLGKEYSSYTGFSRIAAAVAPSAGSGASCSV
ncbi:MAG: hypothetical protein HYS26_01845 [Candidatus Kaiserbacteria bacterium]|nr:MAG: hypothetical protein HYS26_01845 [Candidatus Kaiserbacteria bacterium]